MDSNERLKDLIARFIIKNNFWGYLFSRIRRISVKGLPSIAGVSPEADGTISLSFNPDLFDKTDDENFLFILEHEGMHILNKHIPRLIRMISNEVNETEKREKARIWNLAADCCCNTQAKLPEIIQIAGKPIKAQLPKLYGLPENKHTEWYFKEMLKQYDQIKKSGGGSSEIGNKGDFIGDHSGWENLKGIADASALSRKIDGYISELMSEAVKNFNKQRGRLPGYIESLIEEALKPPKAPYYQIVRKLVRGSRLSKFKRSPTRINRKRGYVFFIGEDLNIPAISPFPGKTRDFTFKIGVLIDTSGSMLNDDIAEGLSGVKNIIEKDRNCKLTVIENDTMIQKEYDVKRISDIDFKPKGRGGTTLLPGLQRFRELNPDVVIAFTDGFIENLNNVPKRFLPKKIIWVIQKDGNVNMLDKTGFIVRI